MGAKKVKQIMDNSLFQKPIDKVVLYV